MIKIKKKIEPLKNFKNIFSAVGVGTGFVQSKWEAIDEEDIKAEAVTSAEIFAETQRIEAEKRSKEVFDKKEAKPEYLMSTAWRKRIRDVELKVIEYCDHLKVKEESEQAEEYRCTLIRQATKEFKSDSRYVKNVEKMFKIKCEISNKKTVSFYFLWWHAIF